jgi:hypothetical protein
MNLRYVLLLLFFLLVLGCGRDDGPENADVIDLSQPPAGDSTILSDVGDGNDVVGADTVADMFEDLGSDAFSDVESDTIPVLSDVLETDVMADVVEGELPSDTVEPDVGEVEPTEWRSALYPEDWTPAFTDEEGRFLHDFSYAGYRAGEQEPGSNIPSFLVDVVADFEADATGESDATAAVQGAIDAVAQAGGGVVFFPPGLYRLDGTLSVTHSSVVLRGESSAESRLYFTKSEGMGYQGHIRFVGNLSSDLEIPLAEDGESRSFQVHVEDASALSIGEDIAIGWVITPGFVAAHGMEGTWQAFNDTWQPFFWREVVGVDTSGNPHVVTVDVPLRYPARVSDMASIRRYTGYLEECGVESLGFANAVEWSAAWAQMQVHVLEMHGVKDAWIRDVVSFPSPVAPGSGFGVGAHLQNGGLMVKSSKRVTIADSHLAEAQNIGGGGCGYLFEVRQSNEVLFRDCSGSNARHNFIQNWGFGVTGCVWLRVLSQGGVGGISETFPGGLSADSEFHHSLATANLIDSSVFHDGWSMVNRDNWSSGAGHTGTENAVWNVGGNGRVRSYQFGWGFVIGSDETIEVKTTSTSKESWGTAPNDFTEGLGQGDLLVPQSLFQDQLERRLEAAAQGTP